MVRVKVCFVLCQPQVVGRMICGATYWRLNAVVSCNKTGCYQSNMSKQKKNNIKNKQAKKLRETGTK